MRIQKLRKTMSSYGVHAALITTSENVTYYSRFSGASSQLLITADRQYIFADFRYAEQAGIETDFSVVETKGTERIKTIFDYVKNEKAGRLGIDLNGVSYSVYKEYQKYIDESRITDLSSDISAQRSVKDENEIKAIARGARYNDMLFRHVCGLIRPGVSENDIKAEIVYYMNKNGAESAFNPIVASGENGSQPHIAPTDRKVAPGDFVTMDYGCKFDGYCSDFTRTVAISHIDKEMQKGYDIVKCAGERAIAALKSGAAAKDIDAIARG
ncbi:MAG: Xaa-Pro peptidase family protein, partial [Eubacteriales bacterium]|nr:Xaa-Pro peptidase family protein [Eubacteriales bacterium]